MTAHIRRLTDDERKDGIPPLVAIDQINKGNATLHRYVSSVLGIPYRQGGGHSGEIKYNSDCSGLVMCAGPRFLAAAGIHDPAMMAALRAGRSTEIVRAVGRLTGFFTQADIQAGNVPAGAVIGYYRGGERHIVITTTDRTGKIIVAESGGGGTDGRIHFMPYQQWVGMRRGVHLMAATIYRGNGEDLPSRYAAAMAKRTEGVPTEDAQFVQAARQYTGQVEFYNAVPRHSASTRVAWHGPAYGRDVDAQTLNAAEARRHGPLRSDISRSW